VIAEALRGRISILAAHTNLDRSEGGINDVLAQLLRLRNVKALPGGGTGIPGLGRVGELPEESTLGLLIRKIKKSLGVTSLRVSGHTDRIIRRVAVVGGAGGSMVSAALAAGADLLITGEIKHHEALLAKDSGLALVDAGHYETEKSALDLFAERLREAFGEAGWAVSIETDGREEPPMKYE
jgi:dinuclear metal center YbgI/SA1388 family protein